MFPEIYATHLEVFLAPSNSSRRLQIPLRFVDNLLSTHAIRTAVGGSRHTQSLSSCAGKRQSSLGCLYFVQMAFFPISSFIRGNRFNLFIFGLEHLRFPETLVGADTKPNIRLAGGRALDSSCLHLPLLGEQVYTATAGFLLWFPSS